MIVSAPSLVYHETMGEKRFIVKPAYYSGSAGRVKLYLIYDTEFPVFDGHVMMPSWVLKDSFGVLQRFAKAKGLPEDDTRLAPARVLSSEEAAKYGSKAIDA